MDSQCEFHKNCIWGRKFTPVFILCIEIRLADQKNNSESASAKHPFVGNVPSLPPPQLRV